MLTAAEIISDLKITADDCTCEISVPFFGIYGKGTQRLTAHICTPPGLSLPYKQGDLVWVDFKENQISDPIILGQLYTPESHNNYEETYANIKTNIGINSLQINKKLIITGEIELGENTTFTLLNEDGAELNKISAENFYNSAQIVGGNTVTTKANEYYTDKLLNTINRVIARQKEQEKDIKTFLCELFYKGTPLPSPLPDSLSTIAVNVVLQALIKGTVDFESGPYLTPGEYSFLKTTQAKSMGNSTIGFLDEVENFCTNNDKINYKDIHKAGSTGRAKPGDIIIVEIKNADNELAYRQLGIVTAVDSDSDEVSIFTVENDEFNTTKRFSTGDISDIIKILTVLKDEIAEPLPDELPVGGKQVFNGKIRIDTDGSPNTLKNINPKYNDRDWQRGTSYAPKGVPLDAYRVPYIVRPLGNTEGKTGEIAYVVNNENNRSVKCVIGDAGPSKNGWGELSMATLWYLGNPDHLNPVSNGKLPTYTIYIFPGQKYDPNDITFWTDEFDWRSLLGADVWDTLYPQ